MAGTEVERSSSSRAQKVPAKKAPVKQRTIEALGIESGTDQVLPFSQAFMPLRDAAGRNGNEELQEVLRGESEDFGPTVRQLIAMRRMDGQARALYRLLTLPIRAALRTATIKPGEDGEEEAKFMEKVFYMPPQNGGMTVTFQRFMSQLLQGLFDGFSAFEKVYWVPETGPLAGKITLKKLAHRPADTVTFIVDKTGGFAGIRQKTYHYQKSIDVFIPKDRAFYYAAQEEEQKFYGVSFFQSAFYHYDKKARLYYTAHIAAQRSAVGTRVGTVPQTATKAAKTEFAAALSNMTLAQWMMMPEGFKVDVAREAGSFEFLNFINHHNSQMSKSVLAQFFDKEQGAGQGEASLVNFGQPGDEMFNLMLRAIMDDIAAQINTYIIPALIDFNFRDGVYPEFTWGSLTDEQRAAIASTFDKVANQQTLTPEFIRALEEKQAEEFGLDLDYDEIEAREEEEAAAQAQVEMEQPGGQFGAEGGQPSLPAPPVAAGGAPALPAAGGPALPEDGAEPTEGAPAPGTESPEAWSSLDDFEDALGIDPEASDENDDFEDQLTLSALDDFETIMSLSGVSIDIEKEEDNLLSLAMSLLEAAGTSRGGRDA